MRWWQQHSGRFSLESGCYSTSSNFRTRNSTTLNTTAHTWWLTVFVTLVVFASSTLLPLVRSDDVSADGLIASTGGYDAGNYVDADVNYCNATDCSACVQQLWYMNSSSVPHYCGWCAGGNKCRTGTVNGPTTGSCAQWEFFGPNFDQNGGSCCVERETCSECNEGNNDYCGWCIQDASSAPFCSNIKASKACPAANATKCCGITDCGDCQSQAECGWCPDNGGSCVPLATANSTTNSSCSTDVVDNCCAVSTTCQDCNSQSVCFWCPSAAGSSNGVCLLSETEKAKCIEPADSTCCVTQSDCSSCNSFEGCDWCMLDSTCIPSQSLTVGVATQTTLTSSNNTCSQIADESCCSLNSDCYSCLQDGCQWCAYHSMCYDKPYSCAGQPLIVDNFLCNRTIVVECEASLTCSDCTSSRDCIWVVESEIGGLQNNQEFCYSGSYFGVSNVNQAIPWAPLKWYWKSCKVTGFGMWIVTAVCLGILAFALLGFASFRFYKYLMWRDQAKSQWVETPRGDENDVFFDSYKERGRASDALVIAEDKPKATRNKEKLRLLA